MSTKIQHTEKEILFFKALEPFVVQAITASFMAFLSDRSSDNITSYLKISPLIKQTIQQYLNICWHGYNLNEDTYIVDTFNDLIAYDLIKNVICLIDWIELISKTIINSLDLDETIKYLRTLEKDKVEQKSVIYMNLKILYNQVTSEISNIGCNEHKCIYKPVDFYDGNDFFIKN
jgi:hypothetical protein